MWRKNALFLGLCLLGAAIVSGSLLKFDRLGSPQHFWPDRFAASTVPSPQLPVQATSSTKSAPARSAGQPPLLEPQRPSDADWAASLERLNAEFRNDWTAKHLEPTPRADDLTIARRLSLALTGTIPSLEEIRALEHVAEKNRIEWWTSHLLEDRRYADYMAERFARAYVGVEDGPFIIYRRRRFVGWLSDSLAANAPYDGIVRQLISDNGLWTGSPATNFVTVTSKQDMNNEPDEIRLAGRTSRAFLGMRIDCLQCHDDNLGTIFVGDPDAKRNGTQHDFHQLAAFFAEAKVGLVGVYDKDEPYKYTYLHDEQESIVPAKAPFGEKYLSGHGSRRERLAAWITHEQNKPFARATVNRVWAIIFGRPLVEPIDDIPLAGDYPPGLEMLADDFVAHGYDLQRLIRLIVASDAYQRDGRADFEITREHEAAWASFPLSRLRPEQVAGSMIQSSSLSTIDAQAHIIARMVKYGQTNDFVKRYGDIGEDEFDDRGGTIPQRLLLMNGELVKERTKESPVTAATRIAGLTKSDDQAVEATYLAVLTRRATEDERAHFVSRLQGKTGSERIAAIEDLYWVLINSTEFSWNH